MLALVVRTRGIGAPLLLPETYVERYVDAHPQVIYMRSLMTGVHITSR